VAVGVSADGLELALDSSRGGASGRDLYLSKRANTTQPWGIPVGIAELNDGTTQKLPQLADDGRAIWFVQTTTTNGDDIMVATRPALDAPFGTPTAVTELNSATAEDDPWISNDQRTIVFASSRNGNFDIFIATR
jgi:Tol biopolymer transport system component